MQAKCDKRENVLTSLVPRPSPCFSMLRAEKLEKAWCILLRNDDVEDAVLDSMATTARARSRSASTLVLASESPRP